MATWRMLGSFLVSIAFARTGWAQTYLLSETSHAGDCFHLQLELTVTGEMRIQRQGGVVPLKHELSATHDFSERFLNIGSSGLPNKSARVYQTAKSVSIVDRDRSEHIFRPERHLFVAQQ